MAEAIPLERQIACVRREVGMRRHVYPRWVATSKMSQDDADRQIATMEAVQATLERLLEWKKAEDKRIAPGLF